MDKVTLTYAIFVFLISVFSVILALKTLFKNANTPFAIIQFSFFFTQAGGKGQPFPPLHGDQRSISSMTKHSMMSPSLISL